jgi:hypothetical protein
MLREIEPDHWREFLDEFSQRNRRRDARLLISGQVGAPRMERDLLLDDVAIRMEGDGAPRAEFTFCGGPDAGPLTRSIPFVRSVAHQNSLGGRDEVLEILSGGGVRALLYFSSRPDTTAA